MKPGDLITMKKSEYPENSFLYLRKNLDGYTQQNICFHEGQIGIFIEEKTLVNKEWGQWTGYNMTTTWWKIICPEGVGWLPSEELKKVK